MVVTKSNDNDVCVCGNSNESILDDQNQEKNFVFVNEWNFSCEWKITTHTHTQQEKKFFWPSKDVYDDAEHHH